MKVKLQIAHQVPGRIRMKVPSAKGDSALLAEIQVKKLNAAVVDVLADAATRSRLVDLGEEKLGEWPL
jgi:hypothetical protein